jgi:hypothetical protein
VVNNVVALEGSRFRTAPCPGRRHPLKLGLAIHELHLIDKTEEDTACWPASGTKPANCLLHYPQPGLLLLANLCRLHHTAAGVSLDWELLDRGAQVS